MTARPRARYTGPVHRQRKDGRRKPAKTRGKSGSAANSPLALQRIAPGATLGHLHRRTGLSMSMLSKLFSGQRTPSARTLKLLADELGTTMDRVLLVIEDARRRRQEQAGKPQIAPQIAPQTPVTSSPTPIN